MATEGHNDILRKLSKRAKDRAEEDAKEWAAEISQAREIGKAEGQEEMRKVLESQHKTDREGWDQEKQELAKKIETLEVELKDSKKLRQLDNEQMQAQVKKMKAQVKEKQTSVNNLEEELAQSKKKVDEMFVQFRKWMGSEEGNQGQVSNQQEEEEKDDDEFSGEDSEARLMEPGPSKKRRLWSSSPPRPYPELSHSDLGGCSCECGVDYDSQAQLEEHLSFMKAGRKYICDICRDDGRRPSYPKRRGLQIHKQKKHKIPSYGGEKLGCDSCGVAFETVEKLEQHLIRNPKTGRLVCPAAFGGSRTPTQKEDQGTPPEVAKTE